VDAMSTLGRPCRGRFPAATLVRIDRDEQLWNIPPIPMEQRAIIGRHPLNIVELDDDSVAPRHAELVWNSDHYDIVDLGSANGTRVNGNLVARAALRDGDEIGLGVTVLRYFIGDDARSRGEAALRAARRR
jgi:hypothetical protein